MFKDNTGARISNESLCCSNESPDTIQSEVYFTVSFSPGIKVPRMEVRVAASKLHWFLTYARVDDIVIS